MIIQPRSPLWIVSKQDNAVRQETSTAYGSSKMATIEAVVVNRAFLVSATIAGAEREASLR